VSGQPWEHSLDLFALLLQRCERYVDLFSQENDIEMLRLGKSLESFFSPYVVQWATSWNIQPSDGSQKKIDGIFEVYNNITWGEKVSNELMDICKRYQWLFEFLERSHDLPLPRDLLDEVTHRVGMHGHFYRYLEKVVTTQFTYQYNYFVQRDTEATIQISDTSRQIAEATQQDSSAMKTVAYLTLAFLPATFVCALFSTGVLNFQNFNSHDSAARIVSPLWWVFVLCCIFITAFTFAIWLLLVHKQKRGIAIYQILKQILNGTLM
jgi:hypothetical protein